MVVQYSLIKELKFCLIKELMLINELESNLIIKYRHSKNAVKTVLLCSGGEINKFLLFCHLWPSYICDIQKYFLFFFSFVRQDHHRLLNQVELKVNDDQLGNSAERGP